MKRTQSVEETPMAGKDSDGRLCGRYRMQWLSESGPVLAILPVTDLNRLGRPWRADWIFASPDFGIMGVTIVPSSSRSMTSNKISSWRAKYSVRLDDRAGRRQGIVQYVFDVAGIGNPHFPHPTPIFASQAPDHTVRPVRSGRLRAREVPRCARLLLPRPNRCTVAALQTPLPPIAREGGKNPVSVSGCP